MKRKLKLRPYVIPSIYVILITIFVISAMSTFEDVPEEQEDLKYVSNVILSNDTPVVATDEVVIIRPYNDPAVTIGKSFYDYKADEESQKNSIVYYENTYIQNSGIDYVKSEAFDVVSVLDGTVISVNNNDLLGNIIPNLESVILPYNSRLIKLAILPKNKPIGVAIANKSVNSKNSILCFLHK